MRRGWLLRDREVLAAADIADSLAERVQGFRRRPDPDVVLVTRGLPALHSLATEHSVDAAFLDQDLRVVAIVRLEPWRVTWPRRRCRLMVQVRAGTFARWGLQVGDALELRDGR